MKAIYINAKVQTISLIDLPVDNNERRHKMYELMGCQMYALGKTYPKGDTLFVDDEGLLTLNDDSMFFQIEDDQPLAGNGILLGAETENFDTGDWTVEDVSLSLVEFAKDVRFYTVFQVQAIAGQY